MSAAGGFRVRIREPRASDAPLYAAAVRRSAELIGQWNPVEPDGFPDLLHRQGDALRTFLLINEEDGGLAGKVNVSGIARGRFCNASLGYDAYLPYAGTGRMTEGLLLVVDRCFAPEPEGLGLHRLEVSVQPGNTRSLALAKRVGFRHEGFSPRFLYLNDAWRDHERFALTSEEWVPLAAR
ncbi:GNAT family N-acetyltransferase [Mangrovactinospora gilvigrisea]|uniref:GNAT family N-acetyltransferase n=1 Tax=Mangrovactinospora gilvigrisea TaxID=1428644 RepID=A0A1J7BDG8_9ACTN|nr:GNAT family protein [Mangrovactinospora gilvigrisea]OIV36723.1 GNAT family N-acetyltransferase [Mangrovactinospora gilvigrisea]